MNCLVCGAAAEPFLTAWLYRCPDCGLRCSRLAEDEFNGHDTVGWEPATARAMSAVRERSAADLLDRLAPFIPAGGSLLDVGSGPGWFLRAAAARGYDAAGIEPDGNIAALARAEGLAVTSGYFPADYTGAAVDIVTFNDVFEHLPAPAAALRAVHEQLRQHGVLVLNLPSARGVFYRVAELLARCGIEAPLERMWQRGFDSPHLYYFDPHALRKLVSAAGFENIGEFTLSPLTVRGLWGRIRAGARFNAATSALIWLLAAAMTPLAAVLPADIMVQVYRRA